MKSYYLAKILHKLRLSSFHQCNIDSTAKVDAECVLAKTRMGRYSYVGAGTAITDAVIGAFCSIGGKCGIGGGMHPMSTVSTSPAFLQGHNILKKNFAKIPYAPSKMVEIGNDVWIGDGAYIMPGIKIGDGAVVGAHAVVTHNVAPYSIVVGVPARELKKRFDDATIEQLMLLRWWDWPDEKLSRYGSFFTSPEELIRQMKNY